MERSLYERYGNNEPYIELDPGSAGFSKRDIFFHSITGPSTNFYVGQEQTHYTIPKRLLYKYSAFAKLRLEGRFAEAEANAVWLPDVSPDIFRWIWRWLYQGELGIERYCYNLHDDDEDMCSYWYDPEKHEQAFHILCRLHMLGERILLDGRFGKLVQAELGTLVERTKEVGASNLFTPEIMQEVLLESAPVKEYYHDAGLSLRSFMLGQLCDHDLCANMDFMSCSKCFELDGVFAAELMMFMARNLVWAVELWGAQTESIVDVVEKKLRLAEEEGKLQSMLKMPKRRSDAWLALRYFCTFQFRTRWGVHSSDSGVHGGRASVGKREVGGGEGTEGESFAREKRTKSGILRIKTSSSVWSIVIAVGIHQHENNNRLSSD